MQTAHWMTVFFRNQPGKHTNPRTCFLQNIQNLILNLRDNGHSVLIMLDANSTLDDSKNLSEMLHTCGLYDLHRSDPPQSTYIGAANCWIDFMFGCKNVLEATTRAGTLSYLEGPQSDHRSLYIDLDTSLLLDHHPMDNAIQTLKSTLRFEILFSTGKLRTSWGTGLNKPSRNQY